MEKKLIESNQKVLFSRGIIVVVIIFTIIMVNSIYGLYESNLRLEAAEAAYKADKYDWALFDGSLTSVSNDEQQIEKYQSEIGRFTIAVMVMIPLTIISILVFVYSFKSSIVVTDKRVYGVSTFGRRVDIPIHAISSVENGMMGGISIIALYKKTSFVALENNNGVYKVIWDLISEKDKQSNNQIVEVIQGDKNDLDIDDLRKYKSLLDDGIISQEEFEVKKQQILKS